MKGCDNLPSIQERIKERRLHLNLTLLDVAERLGVREATVQRYESGEIKNIKHETIGKLAAILECSPSYLMGWQDEVHDVFININEAPLLIDRFLKESDENLETILKLCCSPDEIQILFDYRGLSKQGKEYIRQTMGMAKATYKKDTPISNMETG